MGTFAAMVDALFLNESMAVDASYVPVAGDPATVRVMQKRPDEVTDFGAARLWSEATVFDLRVSDVAAPAAGDQIVIGTETFVVQGEPKRDRERLIWTLDTRPA